MKIIIRTSIGTVDVRPQMSPITLSDFMFSEPIGLEMIYGALREQHEVEIFDMMIESIGLSEKIEIFKPNVIGITSLCIDVNKVLELCAEAKAMDENLK